MLGTMKQAEINSKKKKKFTSLRALSSFGLLSSTLSLDCCFSFLSSAVTEKREAG